MAPDQLLHVRRKMLEMLADQGYFAIGNWLSLGRPKHACPIPLTSCHCRPGKRFDGLCASGHWYAGFPGPISRLISVLNLMYKPRGFRR